MQLNQESTDYLDWFRAVIVPMVRRRIEEGAAKYGELLPPEHDERDFGAEALEELVDAVFYVQRLEMQRHYLVNENRRLMAKLAKVRADLEDTPDAQ
jgi:RimJ/RimL family protein N-acetyltransferase